jgi:hypothetical protein
MVKVDVKVKGDKHLRMDEVVSKISLFNCWSWKRDSICHITVMHWKEHVTILLSWEKVPLVNQMACLVIWKYLPSLRTPMPIGMCHIFDLFAVSTG